MLTENQVNRVWEKLISAETRSLYFGDLAALYTSRKQWITGVSFFLASGAAATLAGGLPHAISEILASIVAILTAYSIAVGLDRKAITMARLHHGWNEIASSCDRLWNHAYEESAESTFEDIARKERELSEVAATEAPNDPNRMDKWQEQVFRQYHLAA